MLRFYLANVKIWFSCNIKFMLNQVSLLIDLMILYVMLTFKCCAVGLHKIPVSQFSGGL